MLTIDKDSLDPVGSATVVVVDDQPANVTLLRGLLHAMGVPRVDGHTHARHGLARCLQDPPALLLLDLHMPDLDGLSFLRELARDLPDDTYVPVLVLTADVTTEAKRRALASGAKDFLTKPFERVEVELRVRNLLETSALYARMQRRHAELRAELDQHLARQRLAAATHRAQLQRINQALETDALHLAFQPVSDLETGHTVGFEALARFSTEPHRPPNEWFAEAHAVGLGVSLELSAVNAALAALHELPPDAYLAINVSPETVLSTVLEELLIDSPCHRVVLELTEHERVASYETLDAALTPLRSRGVRTAVDDAGAGYASLQHILRLRPEIIKLDISLIRELQRDPARRALTSALVTFGREIDATIVAEGIETHQEMAALQRLGVRWGQGYYLGRPCPLPNATNAVQRRDC